MKLQKKLILLNLSSIIVFLFLLGVLTSQTINDSFINLERTYALTQIQRINETFQREIDILETLVTDWAEWDDSYVFMEDQNEGYLDSNLEGGTLKTLALDAMVFYSKSGEIIHSEIQEEGLLGDESLRKEFFDKKWEFFNGDAGTLMVGDKVFVYAVKEVLTSEGEGPMKGKLLMTYILDEEEISLIEVSTKSQIELLAKEDISKEVLEVLESNSFYLDYGQGLDGYLSPGDERGPVFFMTSIERDIYGHGLDTAGALRVIIIALGLIFSCITIFTSIMISRRITDPLEKLSDIARTVGDGNFEVKEEGLGQVEREVENLHREIYGMASNLKKYRERIVRQEKQKGVALEKEVKKKTLELNRKVEDLKETKAAMLNILEDVSNANEDLKELDKTKSEFLNIVSHELKTPLTAMIAHLDVLDDLKKNLTEEELGSLEAIRRNSNNLKMLIGNILEIARMESGKFELTKDKRDVNEIIKQVVDKIRILSKQKGLKIETKLLKLPEISIDGQRIEEVITNLTSNAIKFTDKGMITISSKKVGNFVEISVKDTGVGIPEDKMKNLFQKFYQVDASISRRYGGTGLGLSITKKLVEAHDGEIKVNSTEGKGTEFIVRLPLGTNKNLKKEGLERR